MFQKGKRRISNAQFSKHKQQLTISSTIHPIDSFSHLKKICVDPRNRRHLRSTLNLKKSVAIRRIRQIRVPFEICDQGSVTRPPSAT